MGINNIKEKSKEPRDFEEVTLALALLGSIIFVLFTIIEYFNNYSIDLDSDFRPVIYGLIIFLIMELSIIFLFFIFKGISEYVDDGRENKFEQVARELFKFSFIAAFVWFIDSIVIVSVKYYNITNWYIPIILLSILATVIWYPYQYIIDKLKKYIVYIIVYIIVAIFTVYYFYSKKDYLSLYLVIMLMFFIALLYLIREYEYSIKIPIVISFIILTLLPIEGYNIAPYYLLTGSYSIEEFSPSIDNPDMRTFTMKEKGIRYDLTEVMIFKLDTSKPYISNESIDDSFDYAITYRNGTNDSSKTGHLWVRFFNQVWYFNVINISNMSPGTYLLCAKIENKLGENITFGGSKRIPERLFYIPPKNVNYSVNSTQITNIN